MSRLYIIIPVYNEEENMPSLFHGCRALENELAGRLDVSFILVDDGSSDKTLEQAKKEADGLSLQVLSHSVNQGPGAAFATAFTWLYGRIDGGDWVITMEGDNTSRHDLIQTMLNRSNEGFDVVLASPYMYGGGFTETTFLRRFLSSGANLLVKDLLGIQGILTVSSFFRLFRGSAIIRMQHIFSPRIIERYGFESMVELIMKMTMLKLPISEVAMQLDSSLRRGKSKMKILRTIRGYLTLWFRKSAWQKTVLRDGEK